METAKAEIKAFLFVRMYRHSAILPVWKDARRIVKGLFEKFLAEPESMPEEWAQAARDRSEAERARVVSDYIAGMTDRYAQAQADKWLGKAADRR
jgi:dGTPase